MIRTLIVDDEYLIRYAIRLAVDWTALGFEIIDEAENGEVALSKIKLLHPDLVILDINLPIMNGLEVCKQIKEQNLESDVLILTGYDEFKYIQQCLRMGVLNYVVKPIQKEELQTALQKAKRTIETKIKMNQLSKQSIVFSKTPEELERQFYPDDASVFLRDTSKTSDTHHSIHVNQYSLLSNLVKRENNDFLANINLILDQAIDNRIEKELFYLLCARIINCMLDYAQMQNIVLDSPIKDKLSITTYIDQYKTAKKFKDELVNTCQEFLNLCANYQETNSLAHEALEYIRAHFIDPTLSSSCIADALAITPNYLSKIFKRELGMTVTEYIAQFRVNEAVHLLEKKDSFKIIELAQAVGYTDPFYFSKIFKKIKGVSPSNFIEMQYKLRTK